MLTINTTTKRRPSQAAVIELMMNLRAEAAAATARQAAPYTCRICGGASPSRVACNDCWIRAKGDA